MPNHVVRFPQGTRHGWYLGRDQVVGLRPGREVEWQALWTQYTQQSGQTLDDLQFADKEQGAEFVRDLGL